MKSHVLPACCVLLLPFVAATAEAPKPIRCSIARADKDGVSISWEAAPGKSYAVEATSSLREPWKSAGIYFARTNRLTSRLPIAPRARFFRIAERPRAASVRAADAVATGFAYDARFANYHQNPTEVPERVVSIHRHLRDRGLLNELALITPVADPLTYIAKVHSASHIQGIQAIPVERAHNASESIGTIAELAVGYILGAVRDVCENKVRNAFCNIRPPGHHQVNFGFCYGFCCYANVVIAGRYALERYPNLIKRILIIDWDLHHGNGTQFFVQNDPAFLFYDTCGGGFYSGGDESRHGTMHIHSGIEGFLHEWETELLPMARQFKPDLILISAGFDSKKRDVMGGLGLTARGFSQLTQKVMELADEFSDGRIVSILEGGYSDSGTYPPTYHGLAQCVENHIRTLMTGEVQPETPFYAQ